MKIAFIASGAAGMYCGSCLRDNALANELHSLGHEVLLVPVYTPLRLDDETVSQKKVFFGAVDAFLQEKSSRFRGRRGLISRLLGSQVLLRFISRMSFATRSKSLGKMTVSVLRGGDGNQKRSLIELVDWLRAEAKPQVVHLSNALLSGWAREIKAALGVSVTCGLQGEDFFLEGLPEPYRGEALSLLRENSAHVDRFMAASAFAARRMSEWISLDREKVDVVLSGISLSGYPEVVPQEVVDRPLTLGYFARIAPEKGLHVLVEAFERLCASGEFPDLRLKAAGYLGGENYRYAASIRRWLAARGLSRRVEILGTLDRRQKIEFLRDIDVFSVPATYPDSKGIFVLEALACGVPVVGPNHGVFPELFEATGGGLLHAPGEPADLAEKLAGLLRDKMERRRLGERGHSAVRSRFSSRRMAMDALAMYDKLMVQGPPK